LAGRTLGEAISRYLATLNEALGCMTWARLSLRERRSLASARPYSLVLRGPGGTFLTGNHPLAFEAAQVVRIDDTRGGTTGERFRVVPVRYLYRFVASGDREVLAFHWTPDVTEAGAVTFPHLHIGPAIVGGQTTIRPRDLHKAHVPTGFVPLAAVVRLAIAEFGVGPLRADWDDVLRRA
jgi:hypothetical protein